MGQELVRWVAQIATLAVVFALVDLLLPAGGLRAMVRTVMGLTLLAAILGPVSLWLSGVVGGPPAAALPAWDFQAAAGLLAGGSGTGSLPSPPAGSPSVGEALQRETLQVGLELAAARLRQALSREGLPEAEVAWRGLEEGRLRLQVTLAGGGRMDPRRARELVAGLAGLPPEAVEIVAPQSGSWP